MTAVAVIAKMPPKWKCLFATALYTGMRKGELLALRKADLDFSARLITIRRSHDRETTKGNHADAIPMATELVPYLRAAVCDSPSELVFPRPDGTMMARGVQLELVLRRALRAADIVTGYRHICRRKTCRHAELAPDNGLRRCPKCEMILWPAKQVRPLRFHDIRHTTASLLIMAGADLPAVQRIMRHTDPRITTEFYAHLAPGYLRSAIDRLAISPTPLLPEPPLRAASAASSGAKDGDSKAGRPPPFAAILLQPSRNRVSSGGGSSEKAPVFADLQGSGISGSNRRHSAWENAEGASDGIAEGSEALQVADSIRPGIGEESHPVAPIAPAGKNFGAVLVQGSPLLGTVNGGRAGGAGGAAGAGGPLLTVRDVAAQLGLCTATVYKLVGQGHLPHVRVLNAVRVAPVDLAAFLEARRSSVAGRR